jgi:hypothetical protein
MGPLEWGLVVVGSVAAGLGLVALVLVLWPPASLANPTSKMMAAAWDHGYEDGRAGSSGLRYPYDEPVLETYYQMGLAEGSVRTTGPGYEALREEYQAAWRYGRASRSQNDAARRLAECRRAAMQSNGGEHRDHG